MLLIAQTQSLPAELQTVNLRIAKVQDSHNRGGTVYVVTAESFDAEQRATVTTYPRRPRGAALRGEHMKRIAERVALDRQRVFVLTEEIIPTEAVTRDALARAGVKRVVGREMTLVSVR